MPARHVYALSLVGSATAVHSPPGTGRILRPITRDDRQALAEAMLDAYRGTIDYEGEEMAEAVAEVDRYFSGSDGNVPMPEYSFMLGAGEVLESACMVKHWAAHDCPLVGYVITAARCKRQGLASIVLARSIRQLCMAGYSEVRAVITEGNHASETLFARAGFVRLKQDRA